MDAREVERRVRDLDKAVTAKESSSSLLSILADLSDNVAATEDLLRTTKVGKAVNRLRTHKDAAVARKSADLVAKWKKDVSSGRGTAGTATGAGVKKAGTPQVEDSGRSTPAAVASPRENGANGGDMKKVGKGKDEKGFKSSVPLDRRSSVTDEINTDVTGNAIRDSCLKLMYDGLANMTSEQPNTILSIATAIEFSAFSHLGPETSSTYKTKMRSLFQNLKNKSNPGLRMRVLSGEIAPARLVQMSLEELKSPERREEDKQIQKENMDKAMVAQVEKSISSSLTCGKCGQKKVSYSQAQTRSADEPMTTFCECTVCGNRWKFS